MGVSEATIKLLWGRAAGMCSRPGCKADLTRLVEGGKSYVVGEMAHVIAQAPTGPRGDGIGGTDVYDNLVLLCPTCHRDVDKAAAGVFPEEALREWKRLHEEGVRSFGLEARFSTIEELKSAVGLLLEENYQVWKTLGPKSEVAQTSPGSNAYRLWEMRRVDKLLPNNRRIVNMIRVNQKLLSKSQVVAFAEFTNHADSYEEHVYDRRDSYPLFPESFRDTFQ